MSKQTTILFVEDDPYLGSIINDLLEIENFQVHYHKTAEAALQDFIDHQADLCIFDVMLPGIDGFELGRKIRKLSLDVPILFLTAKSQKEDVIEGFTAGADDYLKKPFAMEELVLRIKALLRRSKAGSQEPDIKQEVSFGKYTFNYMSQTLSYDGKDHVLTNRESEILRLLSGNQNQLVERDLILKKVWRDDSYFNARSMDVFLAMLRKHFKNDPGVSIVNVRGRGFKLLVN